MHGKKWINQKKSLGNININRNAKGKSEILKGKNKNDNLEFQKATRYPSMEFMMSHENKVCNSDGDLSEISENQIYIPNSIQTIKNLKSDENFLKINSFQESSAIANAFRALHQKISLISSENESLKNELSTTIDNLSHLEKKFYQEKINFENQQVIKNNEINEKELHWNNRINEFLSEINSLNKENESQSQLNSDQKQEIEFLIKENSELKLKIQEVNSINSELVRKQESILKDMSSISHTNFENENLINSYKKETAENINKLKDDILKSSKSKIELEKEFTQNKLSYHKLKQESDLYKKSSEEKILKLIIDYNETLNKLKIKEIEVKSKESLIRRLNEELNFFKFESKIAKEEADNCKKMVKEMKNSLNIQKIEKLVELNATQLRKNQTLQIQKKFLEKENGLVALNTERIIGNEKEIRNNRLYSTKKEIPSEISIIPQENKSNFEIPKEILENKLVYQAINSINTQKEINRIEDGDDSIKPSLIHMEFSKEIPSYKYKSKSTKDHQKAPNY